MDPEQMLLTFSVRKKQRSEKTRAGGPEEGSTKKKREGGREGGILLEPV